MATGVLLAATALQVAFQWWRTRTVSRMALISAGLVLAFGGATLLIHDELFIMWKPTVLYLLFAAACWQASGSRRRRSCSASWASRFRPTPGRRRLANGAWAAFFVGMAVANYVFVHGFAKNQRGNIRDDELAAFRMLAVAMLSYDAAALARAVANGTLTEVMCDGKAVS